MISSVVLANFLANCVFHLSVDTSDKNKYQWANRAITFDNDSDTKSGSAQSPLSGFYRMPSMLN